MWIHFRGEQVERRKKRMCFDWLIKGENGGYPVNGYLLSTLPM